MEASILSGLERAERDALERRTAAEAEADRLICDARDRARAIVSAAEGRAREAVAALRDEALAAARAQAQGIDAAEAGARQPEGVAVPAPDGEDERYRRAIELVVAAVLGESDPAAAASGRGGPAEGPAVDRRAVDQRAGARASETEAISC